MSDGTLRIIIDCQEMPPEEEAKVLALRGVLGWFLMEEAVITQEDLIEIPDEVTEFKKQKTLSERLYNVMYVYWEKLGSKGDFQDFRRKHMESMIDQYKSYLD